MDMCLIHRQWVEIQCCEHVRPVVPTTPQPNLTPTMSYPAPTMSYPAPTVSYPAPTVSYPAPTVAYMPTMSIPAPLGTYPSASATYMVSQPPVNNGYVGIPQQPVYMVMPTRMPPQQVYMMNYPTQTQFYTVQGMQ